MTNVGIELVGTALMFWAPRLSDSAFRVLMRMAYTALDNDKAGKPAGMYFGGHELLALTLGPSRGRGPAAERPPRKPETAEREIKRAVTELVKEGAVEVVERGRRGRHAVYRLRLDSGLRSPPNWTPESP